MKTHRMSNSAHDRNPRKDIAIRCRADTSRAAPPAPDQVLSGRRFHRADGPGPAETTELQVLVRKPDGTVGKPTLTLGIDTYSRMIMVWHMS